MEALKPVSPQRMGIACILLFDFPQEYSADLLKRQVIVNICEHPDFFLRKLEIGIKGTCGGNRLTKEEYKKKEQDGTLEPDEIKDYIAPGPFSLVEYLEFIWKDGSWGDETFVAALSMQWLLASHSSECRTSL